MAQHVAHDSRYMGDLHQLCHLGARGPQYEEILSTANYQLIFIESIEIVEASDTSTAILDDVMRVTKRKCMKEPEHVYVAIAVEGHGRHLLRATCLDKLFFSKLLSQFGRRPAVAMPRFPEGAATSFRLLGPAGSGVSGSGMSPLAEEMIAERTDRGLRLSRHLATFQKIAVESSP